MLGAAVNAFFACLTLLLLLLSPPAVASEAEGGEDGGPPSMFNVTLIASCIVHSHTDACKVNGDQTVYADFNRCCQRRCTTGYRMFAKPRIYSPQVNEPYRSDSSSSFHCICCDEHELPQMGTAFGVWSTGLLMMVTVFQTVVAFLLPKQEWVGGAQSPHHDYN